MRRSSSLLVCLLLAAMLGLGSVAHAAETVGCSAAAEAVEGSPAGHVDGDADQVPGDAGKAYPHHHAGCHGHHLASPCAETAAAARPGAPALPAPPLTPVLAGGFASPVLHPPQP